MADKKGGSLRWESREPLFNEIDGLFNQSGGNLAAYSDDRVIRVCKDKTSDWSTPDLTVDMDGYLETLRSNLETQARFIEKVSR